MSLPLGHAAIGLAAYDLTADPAGGSVFRQWQVFAVVVVLANMPDVDVLLGLLYAGNGELFHRGPTHSLFFAGFMALLYTAGARLWPSLPPIGFFRAFLLTGTHLLADYIFTEVPLSLFWPVESAMSSGFQGWGDTVQAVIFKAANDFTVIMFCAAVVIGRRLFGPGRIFCLRPVLVKKTDAKN